MPIADEATRRKAIRVENEPKTPENTDNKVPRGTSVQLPALPPLPVGKTGALVSRREQGAAKQIQNRLTKSGVDAQTARVFARYVVRRDGTQSWSEERVNAAEQEFEQSGGRENPEAIRAAVIASDTSQQPQIDAIHTKVVADLGQDYTSLSEVDRKRLDGVIRHRIAPELITYAGAVQEIVADPKAYGSAGVGVGKGNTFRFNISDLLKPENLLDVIDDVGVEVTVQEEVGHIATIVALSQLRTERTGETGDAFDLALAEASDIFGQLPAEVQSYVREIRGELKENNDALGMEFFRMLLQRDLAVADGKIVTAEGRVLTEQTAPSLLTSLLEVFRRLLKVFADLNTTLKAQLEAEGRTPEEIETLVNRVEAARKSTAIIFREFQKSGDIARTAAYQESYGSIASYQAKRRSENTGSELDGPLSEGSGRGDTGLARGTPPADGEGTQPRDGAQLPAGSTPSAPADPALAAQLAERDKHIAALVAENKEALAEQQRLKQERKAAIDKQKEAIAERDQLADQERKRLLKAEASAAIELLTILRNPESKKLQTERETLAAKLPPAELATYINAQNEVLNEPGQQPMPNAALERLRDYFDSVDFYSHSSVINEELDRRLMREDQQTNQEAAQEGRRELLDAIREQGGLRMDHAIHAREIALMRESKKDPRLFNKTTGKKLDVLRGNLKDLGFNFDTEKDFLEAMGAAIAGKTILSDTGLIGGEENNPFSVAETRTDKGIKPTILRNLVERFKKELGFPNVNVRVVSEMDLPPGAQASQSATALEDVPNWGLFQDQLKAIREDVDLDADAKKAKATTRTQEYHRANPNAASIMDARKAASKLIGTAIPPALREVTYDPNGSNLYRGRDSVGRWQTKRSSTATQEGLAEKFERGTRVNSAMPNIRSGIDAGLQAGHKEASVLRLILLTGFRNGGEGDGNAKVKAYGATSLRNEHVAIDGDTVTFDFIGKLGVRQQHVVIDGPLARDLEARKARGEDALFRTSTDKVLAYFKRIGGSPDFIVHDIRTWNATELAKTLIASNSVPFTESDYWLKRDRVADVVARKLGDTRKVVLESYIDPNVFTNWQESAKVSDGKTRPKFSRGDAETRGQAAQLGRTYEEYERSLRDDLLPSQGRIGAARPRDGAEQLEAEPAAQGLLFFRNSEGQVEGYYDPRADEIVLNASAISSPKRAKEVFLHEVVGHKGIAPALKGINPKGYENLVKLLQNYKLESGASLWEDVQGRYKGANESTLFNEAIARLSENENRSAREETLWKRIVESVKLWLAKKGFKDWTDADVTALIRRSAEGLRAQNGRPVTSEEIQYSRTNDADMAPQKLDAVNQYDWLDNEAKARGKADFQTLLEDDEKAANTLMARWRILHPKLDKTGEIAEDIRSHDIDIRLLKLTKETEGNPFPGRDARTHAQSAIRFLQGSDGVSGDNESRPGEVVAGGQSQKSRLVDWARENNLLIDRLPFRLNGPKDEGVGEHHVFFDSKTNRWIKLTRTSGEKMGIALDIRTREWSTRTGSPLEYLLAIEARNEVLGDDVRVHGIYQDKHNVSVITSQPHRKGTPASTDEIIAEMNKSGFQSLGDAAYYRASDNLLFIDLNDTNAVLHTEAGLLIYDGTASHPTNEELQKLGLPEIGANEEIQFSRKAESNQMGSDVNDEQFASIKNRAEQSPSRKAAAIILKKLNDASPANEYIETNAPLTNTDAIRDTISTLPVDDANLNPLERRSIQSLRDAIRSSGKIGGYEFGPEQLPLLDRRIKLGRPVGNGPTFAGLQSGIRELFGKNAYIVTGLPEGAPSGFVFPSISNTLFLNANGKYPAAFLLGHEFGHLLKRGNAEIYKDLSDYILASAKARPVYNAMLAGNNYRSDQLNDEFVNDFIGTQFNDPTFWKDLAGKDGSLFDKVIRAAISFLNGLKTRVSKLSRDVLPYFDNIPEVRAKLAEALREYRRVGDINEVWGKSSDAELVAGPRRRNSDVNKGQMDMFAAFQPDLQEYTSALEKEGITSQEAKITAATQDLGITSEVAADIIQRATPVTQDAATDLFGQVQPATDITGQAGTTFKPRNIIEGFMSPDFVYKIATSTQVPIGRKIIASKLYERKIKGFHPLWRISVIEREDGDRYWMAENAIDQSANSLSAITSFEESSASQLESRALEPCD